LSEALPIGSIPSGAANVRAAIARASQATGMDFDYLLAQAKLESSLDPSAKAPTSSAAGLYQFTQGTWLQTLDRHAGRHGLDWADAAISGGRVADPTMRAQIMALRYDPQASALMAAELASDNRAELSAELGREPDSAELYLAHFLGIGGAKAFLGALQADPGQSAAALMPKAAAANRTIFYDAGGTPRSVAGVMGLLRGKVSNAMEGASGLDAMNGGGAWAVMDTPAASPATPTANPVPASAGPIQRQFMAVQAQATAPARQSMADVLRTTFAAGGDGASTPAFVRAAYDKLSRFGV